MTTMPLEGTKVKLVGETANSFRKTIKDFDNKNVFDVLGVGRKTTSGEHLVNVTNPHIFGGQVMQFFKGDLEEV